MAAGRRGARWPGRPKETAEIFDMCLFFPFPTTSHLKNATLSALRPASDQVRLEDETPGG